MKILFYIFTAILIGCTNGSSGAGGVATDSKEEVEPLSFKFKSSSNSGLGIQSSEDAIPILFGTLEVSAYYYRPGGENQMGIGSSDGYQTWDSQNWSRWRLIVLNMESGRDFVLPSGGELDMRARAGDHFYDDVTSSFIENVGAFSVDVVSVVGAYSLINSTGMICGPGYLASKVPSDFPDLNFSSSCLGRNIRSAYDGYFLFGRKTLFIRNDWFSLPIQLSLHSNLGSQLQCFTSDVPLTDFQIEIIDSLMNDTLKSDWPVGLYSSSCAQTKRHMISIVPQGNEVATIQFKEKVLPTLPTVTPNGRVIPTPPTRVIGQSVEISVGFNILPSMFVDYASFNSTTDTSDIYLNRESNGAVWGTSLEFRVLKPAILE